MNLMIEKTRLEALCGIHIYCCGSCRNDLPHDDLSWKRIAIQTAHNNLSIKYCPRCGETDLMEMFVKEFRCTSQDCPRCFSSNERNTPVCCVEAITLMPEISFCPICGWDVKSINPHEVFKALRKESIQKCCIDNHLKNPEQACCLECGGRFPFDMTAEEPDKLMETKLTEGEVTAAE